MKEMIAEYKKYKETGILPEEKVKLSSLFVYKLLSYPLIYKYKDILDFDLLSKAKYLKVSEYKGIKDKMNIEDISLSVGYINCPYGSLEHEYIIRISSKYYNKIELGYLNKDKVYKNILFDDKYALIDYLQSKYKKEDKRTMCGVMEVINTCVYDIDNDLLSLT
jgi:hypothetical protein